MRYRRLGGTDLDVSVICFGPMRSAAKTPGEDAKSQAGALALRRALDAGVNFVHSSYEYETRWMMEPVLRDYPKADELHHVIKVPVPDFADGDRFDTAKFRMRIEEALRDLHAERIAVLQWMWRSDPNTDERRVPMLGGIIDDVVATFETMRDEGKCGYLMTFPYTVACAQAALDTGKFDGLIAYYNPIEMEMADLFDDLRAQDKGFLSIRPLYQGILTDERSGQASLAAGDRFADPKYADDFAKRAALVDALGDVIGDSMTKFAVRFTLADPICASVIVGLNTVEQVDGMVAAAEGEYPSLDVVKQVQALWRSGFGLG